MLEDINQALTKYQTKWQQLPQIVALQTSRPDAVGWKVADAEEYARCYKELRGACDKIVETWMNGRWIAKMHLKGTTLQNGTKIIKLMQRRPDSDDALGLDHVDFICQDIKQVEAELQAQQAMKWSWESNDITNDYNWISLWFDGTEAKLKEYGVLDTIIKELKELA